jgi:hypothetical protein
MNISDLAAQKYSEQVSCQLWNIQKRGAIAAHEYLEQVIIQHRNIQTR